MRKAFSSFFVLAIITSLLIGCSSNSQSGQGVLPPQNGSVPVSLSMTDDPPAGVTVLFFQVSLTGASLQPASGQAVSLLPNNNPIQIDVTQLQAASAFLSTVNLDPGTYKSLSLTFADPQLVIFNTSNQSIASTCAVGTVCKLTPTIDSSGTVALSSSPFPVTFASNSPAGFLVDFHLNTIIQPDLSVNLGVTNGITLKQIPPMTAPEPPQFGFLRGTVGTVDTSKNQFTLQTLWGHTFTVQTSSGTAFNGFPSAACMSSGIGCLASGQFVSIQVGGVQSGGILQATQVTYMQAAGQQTAVGTIISMVQSQTVPAQTSMTLLLRAAPTSVSNLPLGGLAGVKIASNATFSVDASGFTIPSSLTFTSISSLTIGQTVQVSIAPGSLTMVPNSVGPGSWTLLPSISFTTNSIQLEPSQLSGSIATINSSASSFTLNPLAAMFFGPMSPVAAQPITVQTTSQTAYQGFSSDDFSGLATQDIVSVRGWIFVQDNGVLDPAITPSVILAQNVTLHSMGMF